jgi:hypothetical protein
MSKKTQITLTDRQYALVVECALNLGLSQAEVIRQALDAFFPRKRRRRSFGCEIRLHIRWLPRVLRRIHPRLSD